jgi:hypothetical protein
MQDQLHHQEQRQLGTNHGSDVLSSQQQYLLMDLPCDVLHQIGNVYLNPLERSRLSSCTKVLNDLLPPLLRIKIVSSSAGKQRGQEQQGDNNHFHCLMDAFFVTPVIDEENEDDDDESNEDNDYDQVNNVNKSQCKNHLGMDRCLTAGDNLIYGQQYYLWTFDYQRGNRVYLGRHTRHGMKNTETGMLQHRYSIGLRPKSPNQTWQVTGNNNNDDGDVVMWGDDVGLLVGGNNPHPRLPDSHERTLLSCRHNVDDPSPSMADEDNNSNNVNNSNTSRSPSTATWCTVQSEWGIHERLQLLPVDQFVPGPDVDEKELNVHAIPEACDEGEYLLHSPASLRDGLPVCDGFHVIVKFDFWMEKGVMNFYAPVLPFALGIPILESDYCTDSDGHCRPWSAKTTGPISNLLDIKSARWGCLIYYMAVAADITEGKTLDMDRFLRRVTDHEDHTVRINQRMDYVYIDVKGKKVNQNAPEIPRHFRNSTNYESSKNGVAPWCFVLSW